jgi:hypothetical protein
MPAGAQLPESLREKWGTLLETSSFAARSRAAYGSFLQMGDGILLETVLDHAALFYFDSEAM